MMTAPLEFCATISSLSLGVLGGLLGLELWGKARRSLEETIVFAQNCSLASILLLASVAPQILSGSELEQLALPISSLLVAVMLAAVYTHIMWTAFVTRQIKIRFKPSYVLLAVTPIVIAAGAINPFALGYWLVYSLVLLFVAAVLIYRVAVSIFWLSKVS